MASRLPGEGEAAYSLPTAPAGGEIHAALLGPPPTSLPSGFLLKDLELPSLVCLLLRASHRHSTLRRVCLPRAWPPLLNRPDKSVRGPAQHAPWPSDTPSPFSAFGSKLLLGHEDSGFLSRPCRKRRPSSRDDRGVWWVFSSCGVSVVDLPLQGIERAVVLGLQGHRLKGMSILRVKSRSSVAFLGTCRAGWKQTYHLRLTR